MTLTDIINKTISPLRHLAPIFPGVGYKFYDGIWTLVDSKRLQDKLEKGKDRGLASKLFISLPAKIITGATSGAIELASVTGFYETIQLANEGRHLEAVGLGFANILMRYVGYHIFKKIEDNAEQKIEELELKHYGRKLPKISAIADLRRLLNFSDYTYAVGDFLQRKATRYTAIALGFAGAGFAANYVPVIKDFLPNITLKQALFWPIIVGAASAVTGACVKQLPRLYSQGFLTAAQGNFLNLMEDYRKSEQKEQLEEFWNRIFKYESLIKFTDEERDKETKYIKEQIEKLTKALKNSLSEETLKFLRPNGDGNIEELVDDLLDNQPLTDTVEKTKEGFLMSAKYALNEYVPQKEKKLRTGVSLGLYEDWRDGAYLSTEDTRIVEQAKGNLTLKMLGKDVFGKKDIVKNIYRRISQAIWFKLATRSVTTNIGKSVNRLGAKYRDNFNAQVLLWPGHENSKWLEQFEGAKKEVIEERIDIIKTAFGPDWDSASKMIERMVMPNFDWATEVRARYDAEYIDGTLDYNWLNDLKRMGYSREKIYQASKRMKKSKKDLDEFVQYLQQERPKLLDFENAESLRAVKTAYHHNRDDLKKHFKISWLKKRNEQTVNDIIDNISSEKERSKYSRKLLKIRIHQQLTIFEVEGYKRLVKALAFPEEKTAFVEQTHSFPNIVSEEQLYSEPAINTATQ